MYHGSSTNLRNIKLSEVDIVLTTYETVSSDFNKRGALQETSWFRIVLDEGMLCLSKITDQMVEPSLCTDCLVTFAMNKLSWDLPPRACYANYILLQQHTK